MLMSLLSRKLVRSVVTLDYSPLQKTVALTSCLALSAAHVIVMVITWIKTYHHVKEASQLGIGVRISTVLLRDGEVPYGDILLYN